MRAQEISARSRVTLRFTLSLADGHVVEEAGGDEPMELTIGDAMLVEALEQRLLGLRPGERASFPVSAAEHAFGVYETEKILKLPKKDFDADTELAEGHIVAFSLPNGEEVPGTLRRVEGDQVEVDFNHPLVGRDFVFDVEILSVDNAP